jgi:hypothetical protein
LPPKFRIRKSVAIIINAKSPKAGHEALSCDRLAAHTRHRPVGHPCLTGRWITHTAFPALLPKHPLADLASMASLVELLEEVLTILFPE